MYIRESFWELEKHLTQKQITIITGLRRVGKTTALRHLLTKIPHENKLFLDLERVEHRYLFNQSTYRDIEIGLEIEGIDLSKEAAIALDEIQLVPNITSVIKYLYDTYKIKFIVTGSSSFYLKNHFSESLAGRKRVFDMYPLSFNEFLQFKEVKSTGVKGPFPAYNPSFYNKYKQLYHEYVQFGGFPEVALADGDDNKIAYLKDIVNSYIELDIKLLSDFSASEDLYKLIRLVSARVGSKIDYSKIGGISGINRQKVKEYFTFLEHTFFIKTITPFTRNKDREIATMPKFYFTDTGILNILGQIPSGALFENAVFNQISRNAEVQYYNTKSGQEIDFIIDGKIAIEVKEAPTESDLATLASRTKSIKLKEYYLLGAKPAGNGFKDFTWAGSLL
jgi:predicted AAA+ superfamily ATPase